MLSHIGAKMVIDQMKQLGNTNTTIWLFSCYRNRIEQYLQKGISVRMENRLNSAYRILNTRFSTASLRKRSTYLSILKYPRIASQSYQNKTCSSAVYCCVVTPLFSYLYTQPWKVADRRR